MIRFLIFWISSESSSAILVKLFGVDGVGGVEGNARDEDEDDAEAVHRPKNDGAFLLGVDAWTERLEDDTFGVKVGVPDGEGVREGVQEDGVSEGVEKLSRPFGKTVL